MQQLKEASVTTADLQISDPVKPLVFKTDAPTYAIGAVLERQGKPITLESKKTGERERLLEAYENDLR